jgi:hypothetical protein
VVKEATVKTLRLSLILVTASCLSTGSAPVTARDTPSSVGKKNLSAATRQALLRAHSANASAANAEHLSPRTLRELARARRATARFHDVANAVAAGYVDANLYTPGEGFHYVKESLIDTTFDPAKPEVLLYANCGDDGLRLVAVEYLSPDSAPPPGGFTGDADVWELEPPFPVWVVNAWIWLHNPDGLFTFANPRVP